MKLMSVRHSTREHRDGPPRYVSFAKPPRLGLNCQTRTIGWKLFPCQAFKHWVQPRTAQSRIPRALADWWFLGSFSGPFGFRDCCCCMSTSRRYPFVAAPRSVGPLREVGSDEGSWWHQALRVMTSTKREKARRYPFVAAPRSVGPLREVGSVALGWCLRDQP